MNRMLFHGTWHLKTILIVSKKETVQQIKILPICIKIFTVFSLSENGPNVLMNKHRDIKVFDLKNAF